MGPNGGGGGRGFLIGGIEHRWPGAVGARVARRMTAVMCSRREMVWGDGHMAPHPLVSQRAPDRTVSLGSSPIWSLQGTAPAFCTVLYFTVVVLLAAACGLEAWATRMLPAPSMLGADTHIAFDVLHCQAVPSELILYRQLFFALGLGRSFWHDAGEDDGNALLCSWLVMPSQ